MKKIIILLIIIVIRIRNPSKKNDNCIPIYYLKAADWFCAEVTINRILDGSIDTAHDVTYQSTAPSSSRTIMSPLSTNPTGGQYRRIVTTKSSFELKDNDAVVFNNGDDDNIVCITDDDAEMPSGINSGSKGYGQGQRLRSSDQPVELADDNDVRDICELFECG